MLRALLLSLMLSLCASYQLAKMAPRAALRADKRAAPLLMQEQEDASAEEPVGPMASEVVGSSPFSLEGIGKPTIGGGKFTPAEPIDETKRMSAPIPMVYLYAVFALFIAGGVLTDSGGPHGFKMP